MPADYQQIYQQILPWLWIGGISALVSLLIFILIWWSIFSKAGHSGARSLLLLIPIVNIIIFLIFAFGEWPIHRDVDALQQENAILRQQLASMQQGQQFGSNPNYPPVQQGYQSGPNYPRQYPFNQ